MSEEFDRVTIQTMHKGAQTIAEFRRIWESWTSDERAAFKSVVDDAFALQDKSAQFVPRVDIQLSICEQVGEDDFNSISPHPSVLKKAIEYWERGDHFAPQGPFGYCD